MQLHGAVRPRDGLLGCRVAHIRPWFWGGSVWAELPVGPLPRPPSLGRYASTAALLGREQTWLLGSVLSHITKSHLPVQLLVGAQVASGLC